MATNRSPTRLNSGQRSPNHRTRSSSDARLSYNPLIVLCGRGLHSYYELHYDDGSGSGLQPLPQSVSEFLMNSGIERLLDQLVVANDGGSGRASKKAIRSMPIVKIVEDHVNGQSHCAICKERFEIDCEAREFPCKHIYHSGCILPWLHRRCSCPICRYELPRDGEDSGEEGMMIWRLPRGGFAVGPINVNGGEEMELPGVYTELDAGFRRIGSPSGTTRNFVTWEEYARIVGESERRGGGGIGRVFNRFLSFIGRNRNGSLSSRWNSVFNRFSRASRNQRPWPHIYDN